MTHDDIAMQTRCLYCLREQYAFNVIPVSYGDAGCTWCGVVSREMTWNEYAKEIAAAYGKAIGNVELKPTARFRAPAQRRTHE